MQQNNIINRLEDFIKKYYQNQLLKGLILGVSLIVIAFFAVSFMEYLGHFEVITRTFIFYLFVCLSLGIILVYIVQPILGLINIRRHFGYTEAAKLIGNHFPEVQDKLTNTMQLQAILEKERNPLLEASIHQRIKNLSPIPFSRAIPTQKNKTYIKFALIPAMVLLFVLLVSPGFKNSGERIVRYQTHFEQVAPFRFVCDIEKQIAIQNSSFTIPLSIEGEEIPQQAYIHVGNNKYKMKSSEGGSFTYELSNVQQSEQIYFEAGGFSSNEYLLRVASKPSLINTSATLIYPAYLNLPAEKIQQTSQLDIPQGTTIQWDIITKNVKRILLTPSNDTLVPQQNNTTFKMRFMNSNLLKINTQNEWVNQGDSMIYTIKAIPDQFPRITVSSQTDSLRKKLVYFIGDISDDHGFSKLEFHYTPLRKANKDSLTTRETTIEINPRVTKQGFYHFWNLEALNLKPGDRIDYYFTVWDNDGVNGAKSTQTPVETYALPSAQEIQRQQDKTNLEIKASMHNVQSELQALEEEMNSIEKMMTEKKNLDWNDKRKIQELLDKKQAIEKQIEKAIRKNLEKNIQENEFSPLQDDLLEKQKKLEKIMEEVLDDKTRELMDKIKQLMQENQNDELQKALKSLKFDELQMNKEMDRLLELFKELELEKKLNQTIEKLNKLANQQKELAQENRSKKEAKTIEKQEVLNRKFNEIKKDIKDIQQKNNQLEQPLNMNANEEKQNSIQQKMNDALSNQKKGKSKSATQNMDEAAEELQQLAQKIQQEMEEAYEKEQEEDYHNLRQILENLIQLSFDQEVLIKEFEKNQSYSSKYVELRQDQQRIKDNTKMVEDSLLALSKRNLEIQSFINEEIARVNLNLNQSLNYLGDRQTNNALISQQYAMTGYNNLALMLSESLKKMQESLKAQKQNKGKPKGSCKKPGGGEKGKKPQKRNASAIKKLQDELAKQMKELKEGQQQGKGKPSSKEFAEMAAKQAAIRKKIQDLHRQLQKEGRGGSLGDLRKTQDLMDQMEEDLYNKRFNNQTFQKLNQIEFKLSEHEKAEKEQEQDQQRTSNRGENSTRPMPKNIEKYLQEKENEIEFIQRISPELQPYYKQKVESYFAK